MNKKGATILGPIAVALLLACAACTLLQETLQSDVRSSPSVEPLGEIAAANPALRAEERIALATVRRSDGYKDIADSIAGWIPPCVERLPRGPYAVVFTLGLPERPTSETQFHVYPYAIFFFDPASQQVVDAYCVTPDLAREQLVLVSLLRDESQIRPMSACVANTLRQTRDSILLRHGGDGIVGLKRPCDDSITQPVTECWCVDPIPPHMDYSCLSDCWAVCDVLPPTPRAACYAACAAGCVVSAGCAELECETIYPCDW